MIARNLNCLEVYKHRNPETRLKSTIDEQNVTSYALRDTAELVPSMINRSPEDSGSLPINIKGYINGRDSVSKTSSTKSPTLAHSLLHRKSCPAVLNCACENMHIAVKARTYQDEAGVSGLRIPRVWETCNWPSTSGARPMAASRNVLLIMRQSIAYHR